MKTQNNRNKIFRDNCKDYFFFIFLQLRQHHFWLELFHFEFEPLSGIRSNLPSLSDSGLQLIWRFIGKHIHLGGLSGKEIVNLLHFQSQRRIEIIA